MSSKMKSEACRFTQRIEHDPQLRPGRDVAGVAFDDRVAVLLVPAQLADAGEGALPMNWNVWKPSTSLVGVADHDLVALAAAEIEDAVRRRDELSSDPSMKNRSAPPPPAMMSAPATPRSRLAAPLPVMRSPKSEPWTPSTLNEAVALGLAADSPCRWRDRRSPPAAELRSTWRSRCRRRRAARRRRHRPTRMSLPPPPARQVVAAAAVEESAPPSPRRTLRSIAAVEIVGP